ncbi:glycosyltransferase family 87 protein [Mesorhizobium sp. KR2-14]|uniref:glycosyltransferase family 87 protein n=1 Tax=Mesorhizobium sp. KR2-14 TaxID=3156610 RepID=UPI0032B541D4
MSLLGERHRLINIHARKLALRQAFDRLGLGLWGLAFLGAAIQAAMSQSRAVIPAYRQSVENFFSHQPLYNLELSMGFLYAPAFAVLFAPFLKLAPLFGDFLWRLVGFAVLTAAATKEVRKIGGSNMVWMLSFGLFLALPMSLGAMRTGQATVLMAGACWFLTFAVLEGRRAETFLWASVAMVAKPTAIVMILLCGALRPRQIPMLVLSLLFVFAVPYAFAPFDYVNAQHHDFIRLLTSMGVDKSGPFLAADFTAPFLAIGAPLAESGATVVRIVAAALTLATVIWFDRQADGKLTTLAIFLAAAVYMTVFNPRVESNTYIMLAVPAAIAIAYLWREDQGGARRIVLSVAIFLCGLSGVERHLHDFLNLWFRPLAMTLISLPLLWWLRGKVHVKTTAVACG